MYLTLPLNELPVHISEQTTLCCTNRKQKHPPTIEIEIRWTPNISYLIISIVVLPSHFRKLQ